MRNRYIDGIDRNSRLVFFFFFSGFIVYDEYL